MALGVLVEELAVVTEPEVALAPEVATAQGAVAVLEMEQVIR